MEASFENAHENYRIFISAEPSADPQYHIIPQVRQLFSFINQTWLGARLLLVLN